MSWFGSLVFWTLHSNGPCNSSPEQYPGSVTDLNITETMKTRNGLVSWPDLPQHRAWLSQSKNMDIPVSATDSREKLVMSHGHGLAIVGWVRGVSYCDRPWLAQLDDLLKVQLAVVGIGGDIAQAGIPRNMCVPFGEAIPSKRRFTIMRCVLYIHE